MGASLLPGNKTLTGYVGGIRSLNKPNQGIEFLVGAGYWGLKNADDMDVSFPETKNHNLYLTPQLGYRSVKPATGLLFRATLTPWLFVDKGLGKIRFTPGVGFSIGKVF